MCPRTFSPAVEAQHRRLDADAYGNIYVVGDVHGCRPALERLLDELDPVPTELVVFVGDLVRRGPDSRGVVDLIRSMPNAVSIRGNNEEKVITGRRPAEDLTPEDLRWLRSLPAALSWEDHLVVHGGVRPDRPYREHTLEDVQNTETLETDAGEPVYWWEQYAGPDRVFFGHKVLDRPYLGDHAVGLDTGCVYGGTLTAYDCARDRTVSVEPDRTYEGRSPEKFLDPYDPAAS
jgi:serine/threonine protein phosphatase 1